MSIFISKNFRFSEFACPCCGKIKPIDSRLIFLLQSLRNKIDKPIYISKGGGLRCKKYNRKINGYKYSPHLLGKAVDIHTKKMGIIDLAIAAKNISFSRIGLYPYNHFVHIDVVRPYRSASWVREDGYHYFKTLEQAIKFINRWSIYIFNNLCYNNLKGGENID